MTEPAFDKSDNQGLKHLFNATRFSLEGLVSAFRHEAAFRQEIGIGILVIASGAWFSRSLAEILVLSCAILLVLIVELLNSGIEAAVDRLGTEFNEYAKMAKDYGSAAVMLAIIIVALVWAYIVYSGWMAA